VLIAIRIPGNPVHRSPLLLGEGGLLGFAIRRIGKPDLSTVHLSHYIQTLDVPIAPLLYLPHRHANLTRQHRLSIFHAGRYVQPRTSNYQLQLTRGTRSLIHQIPKYCKPQATTRERGWWLLTFCPLQQEIASCNP
jgi:hypothetical protein